MSLLCLNVLPQKHSRLTSTIASHRTITGIEREDEILKKIKIQMAVSITCHSAILAIDHLGEITVRHGTGSTLSKMRLHRTKCTSITINVISKAVYENLCNDMAGQKFCLMVDESTDTACKKLLCLAVRYYS